MDEPSKQKETSEDQSAVFEIILLYQSRLESQQVITIVKKRKILGVVVNDELRFRQHIQEKTKNAFKALSSITHFGNDKNGCSQRVFINL